MFYAHALLSRSCGFRSSTKYERNMHIGMNEFEIFERAEDIELDTDILYFTIPDEDFPAGSPDHV